jgi:hypothetical protein
MLAATHRLLRGQYFAKRLDGREVDRTEAAAFLHPVIEARYRSEGFRHSPTPSHQ